MTCDKRDGSVMQVTWPVIERHLTWDDRVCDESDTMK